MTTWNGEHEDLEFACRDCGFTSKIKINPANDKDLVKLGKWLLTHSSDGGVYYSVPSEKGVKKKIEEIEKQLNELKKSIK